MGRTLNQDKRDKSMKREEFVQELTGHIIPFWNKLRDDENGGFTGFMDSALNVDKKRALSCTPAFCGSIPTRIWS